MAPDRGGGDAPSDPLRIGAVGVTGISGKTSLPLLPTAYQARDRLRPLGPRLEHSRLVVVEAAAGYGKTTLLAANVRDSRRHLFWYTFDNLDVDLRSFCQNLAGWLGIEGADAGLDAGASSAHLSQMLLAELLGRLQSTEEGWNVVFDDLHAVRSLPEVLRFIDDLARLLPAGCTLYLASREPVGIHIAKLRALGQVAIVKERDLQFTRQETASLFRAALPDLTVHPRDLDRLAAKTEGWAAGLGICLRFLEAMPGRSLKQALSRLDSTGPDWFSYFAEEVLQTLDRPLQAFLLRASLLPRLEPDLCKRVLGINDSREMLETLDRRNLFTFPVSEERTSYRFHQLFHDFLGRQLAQKVPAEEICRLRRRAARQLASEAAWLEAAEIYSTNGDSAAALALLEKHGKEVLGEGHSGRLLRILESLPPRSFAGRPGALAVLGHAHDVQGHWDEAMTLYARALRLRPPAFARAELMVMMARIYNLRGDYARCSRMCHHALATPGWRHRPTWTRAHGLLGTSAAETGKFAEAEEHYRRAAVVLAKGNDLPGQAYLHYLMAINVHAPRGEFSAAKEAGRRALRLCRRIRDRRGIIYSLGVLGFVTVAAGEEVEARDLAEDALYQAEVEGNRSFAGFCQVVLGRCALLRGDLTDAETHFQDALRAGEPLGDTDLRTYPQLGLAEVALARGNRHSGRSAAIEAL